MSARATFVLEAVRSAEHLPESLRLHATNVTSLKERELDASYIKNFDTLIRLNAHWAKEKVERMKQRQAALEPFCGVILLFGRVKADRFEYNVVVHTATGAVIDWEEHVPDHGI